MNKEDRILLVDPKSITHGPPEIIRKQDQALSKFYSLTLDEAINKMLDNSFLSLHNYNAVSNRCISNYGLLMLGQLFKEAGAEVDYVNGDYYEDQSNFYSSIVNKAEECYALCFTATTPQYLDVKNIAERLRVLFPNKLLVYGGPHAYFFKNHYESNPFHLICIGYDIKKSGNKILELIQKHTLPDKCLLYNATGYTDLAKDFSLIPLNYLRETLLYSYISFGCPNKCRYCIEHYFSEKICSLHLEHKLEEIKFLINKAKVRVIHLADSDFFINPRFASDFLDMLEKQGLNCCFTVNTSPKVICKKETASLIKRFVKNGLVEILIGVEYLSEKELSYMNKKYSISDFYSVLSDIRESTPELIVSFYSLIGLPGESKFSIEENVLWTLKFKESLLFDFSFPKYFVPYPGSEIFEYPEKYKVEILHRKWDEYHRWSLPRPIRINGVSDDVFTDELLALYNVSNVSIN